jgi:hypothetical protein
MRFYPYNITDTCAVWNVLSSATLYRAALDAGCYFACTSYVLYECLTKPRKTPTTADATLCHRLTRERAQGRFQEFHLTLDELEDVAILEKRRKLAKGELSSIAFARKNRQAFLTDDKKAKRFGDEICDAGMCQTTPQMLGWLFSNGRLVDSDLTMVIREHEEVNRPLSQQFEAKYHEGLQHRLMETKSA